jgi:hypothetical protein
MAKLIYAAITSLDGYVAGEQGISSELSRMTGGRVHQRPEALGRHLRLRAAKVETMAGKSTPPSPPSRR